MDNNITTNDQNSFDIKAILSKVLPRWYWFVLSLVVCLCYAYYNNLHIIPQYSCNATVMLKNNANPQRLVGLTALAPTTDIENEIGQLKSNTLARMTLRKLDFQVTYYREGHYSADRELYRNKPFVVEFDSTHIQPEGKKIHVRFVDDNIFELSIGDDKAIRKASVGEWIESDNMRFCLKLTEGTPQIAKGNNFYFIKNNFEGMVAKYSSNLKVQQKSSGSSIVYLTLFGEVPEKLEDYINTLSLSYLDYSLERKNRILLQTIQFIDTMLISLSDSINTAQKDILRMQQNSRVSSEDELKDIDETIKNLKSEISETIVRQNYYRYLKDALQNNSSLSSVVPPSLANVTDPVVDGYLQQINEKVSEKTGLKFSVRDGDNIAPYNRVDYDISEIKKQCTEYVILADSILEINKKKLNSQIAQIRASVTTIPADKWYEMKITKQFDLNNELYNSLLDKRYNASITYASNQPDAEIVDAATWITRYPIASIGGFSYSKAIIIGLSIPALIIALMIFLENKITDEAEIEKATKQTPIGHIPKNLHHSPIPVSVHPASSIAEAFRALRTNLQFIDADNKHKIVLITSTVSGEGKTFVSVNLSIITAANAKKVLLIGLDLRKPRIQEYFNIDSNVGISSYLIGECSFEDTIFKTEHPGLDFAPPGPIPPNPSELIGSVAMSEYLNRASQNYDLVFIDTAPVGIVSDALMLKNHVSAFIYIIRQNYSLKSVLKLYNELRDNGYPKMNIVFNGIVNKLGKYGKYSYRYNNYYNGYYSDGESKKKSFLKKLFKKSR